MRTELIVMLTNHDLVVDNAMDIFEQAKNAPAEHWGFKNVGQPEEYLKKLAGKIKEAGKKLYFEVLEEKEEKALYWVEFAIKNHFDGFLGLKYFSSVKERLHTGGIKYIPFLGAGQGGRIYGSIEEIQAQAKKLEKAGADGVNLSAFRYDGDSEALLKAVTENIHIPVYVAGSVNGRDRIDLLKQYGVHAFTIGGAFFDGLFGNDFSAQICTVKEYLDREWPGENI